MTITQIKYALALEQFRHFQRAANASFITQSTLSLQIQKLEQTLDTIIFDRSQKPITLTPKGEVLIEQFRRTLYEYDQIFSIVDELKGEVRGHYRLGVIPTLAPAVVPQLLANLKEHYPDVHLTIRELNTDEIRSQLQYGLLDGGLLATPLGDHKIIEYPVAHEELVLVHHSSLSLHVDEHDQDFLNQLPLHHLILLREGHCLRNQTLDLCALNDQATTTQGGRQIEANSLQMIWSILMSGPYFTVLPELIVKRVMSMLQNQPNDSPLSVRRVEVDTPYREISLIAHRPERLTSIRQAIGELLMHDLKTQLSWVDGRLMSP